MRLIITRGGRPVQDHETLEVRVGASEPEVRRAYRRLAKSLHPDRNPGDPAASARFAALAAARDRMLARRAVAASPAGKAPASPQPAASPVDPVVTKRSGDDMAAATSRISLSEAVAGGMATASLKIPRQCAGCLGTGRVSCTACARSSAIAFLFRRLPMLGCVACGDRGRTRTGGTVACGGCGGAGRAASASVLRFAVPAGTCDGQILRVRTPEGDVVAVRIEVDLPPRVVRRGDDLEIQCRIPRRSLREGEPIVVNAPDGGIYRVRVPSGATPDTVLRLSGCGMTRRGGGRGDLLVRGG